MQVSTQPSSSSIFAPYKDQFLIVPIFFKQQIESIIAAKAPEYAFGFFYGEQRENFRIIKKIWPLPRLKVLKGTLRLVQKTSKRPGSWKETSFAC